ncbi:helix-turn-helix domain-containing protein [Tissierella praeacuta]|uniref:helix-turn-helix domain-containing protein n=1 Tax=Tissierella praeacuta TaxID=43131 RepID=UPI00289A8EE7|nr:helix-turn-helix domain-containing protein [Tissierella praeacuta]
MSYFGTIYSYSSDELPARAKTVYMYLKDRSDAKGECWPAINTIARETSMSRSTVKRAITDLIRCGLLTKEARYRENGSNSSNRYFLKK